jgi:hypothetical protein
VPPVLGTPAERRGAESNTSGVNFWALTVIMLVLMEELKRCVKHQGMVNIYDANTLGLEGKLEAPHRTFLFGYSYFDPCFPYTEV